VQKHCEPDVAQRRRDELARLYAAAERMRLVIIALVAVAAVLLSVIALGR
jgi:hypothetical protein